MFLPIYGEVARRAGGADISPSSAPSVTEVGALLAHFLVEVGMKDEIKGKAHEIKGKITGDKSEEMKGVAERERDQAEREREAETVRERRSW
jgi:uncharacterized protein YjbJ (UPF0337 family)